MPGTHYIRSGPPLSHADRILVVENALIVESGRHEELLHRGGRYASSYRLQLMEQATERQPIAIGGQPALRLPPAFPIYLKRRLFQNQYDLTGA